MICENCGNEMLDNTHFFGVHRCLNCGIEYNVYSKIWEYNEEEVNRL